MRFFKSIILLLFLGFSSLPIFAQYIPASIERALNNAPEDYLVGIGVAKAETDWDSMSLAETLAREDLAAQFSSIFGKTIREYEAIQEETGASLTFQESFYITRTAVYIRDSWIAELEKTSDGAWWCVVYCHKNTLSDILSELSFPDWPETN
jgi:hypothetical protein